MDVPSAVVDSTAWSASHRRPIEPDPIPREHPSLETAAETAARLKLTVRRVRHLAATGQIPHVRISERQLRFDPDAVDAWIASRLCGGETSPEVAALVERTTEASGVPLRVEDPAVLASVAGLLRPSSTGRQGHA